MVAGMNKFAAIILAAGRSTRFGGGRSKVHLDLNGIPVWRHSLAAFRDAGFGDQVILVVDGVNVDRLRAENPSLTVIAGGESRADSVSRALDAVRAGITHVAIHDAARPCVTFAIIRDVCVRATETGAAIVGISSTNTLHLRKDDGELGSTLDRSQVVVAQTPQAFGLFMIWSAYRSLDADAIPTDDAGVMIAAGYTVAVVPGSPLNIKITTPDDLVLAGAILSTRAGQP